MAWPNRQQHLGAVPQEASGWLLPWLLVRGAHSPWTPSTRINTNAERIGRLANLSNVLLGPNVRSWPTNQSTANERIFPLD